MTSRAVLVERVPPPGQWPAEASAQVRPGAPRPPAGTRLPDLDAPDLQDAGVLCAWLDLKTGQCDLAAARRNALRYLVRLRRAGTDAPFRHHAQMVVAEYHFHSGRPDKGASRLERVVARLREAGSPERVADVSQRLAHMHAAAGDHARALACLRQARSDRAVRQSQLGHLRARLATLKRELQQRHEAAAHRQRLAVVGRLMSDIHHALGQPIALMHRTLAGCTAPLPPQALAQALHQVIEQVDQATGLARQIRMFSYRAAPQAMVVDLHDSLREAWDGVALWRGGVVRELQVSGELATQVRVDAQRLAVLLRILLIEADKAALLEARIACGVRFNRLELTCPAGTAGNLAAGDTSVGLTLCREIAHEMGGRLTRTVAARGHLGFTLELPAR